MKFDSSYAVFLASISLVIVVMIGNYLKNNKINLLNNNNNNNVKTIKTSSSLSPSPKSSTTTLKKSPSSNTMKSSSSSSSLASLLLSNPLRRLSASPSPKSSSSMKPSISSGSLSSLLQSPHFLPARVPLYEWQSPVLNRWVELLDNIGEYRIVEDYDKIKNFLDTFLIYDDTFIISEIKSLSTFELECLHFVLGWSFHAIGLHQSLSTNPPSKPSYHPAIIQWSQLVAKRLTVCVGGCANVSFMYNWKHTELPPGSEYDPCSLSHDDIEPRFHLLPPPYRSSLWNFLKGHILMESGSTVIFKRIEELYHLIIQSERCERDPDTNELILSEKMMDDAREYLGDINDRMLKIVSTMSQYMHVSLVNPNEWPMVQQLLKLEYEEQKGISGLQNCWIFALNFVMGVDEASHPSNRDLEELAWPHLLRHQFALMKNYQSKRTVLRDWVKSVDDIAIKRSFTAIVERLITWRAIHRTRATTFVSRAMQQPAKKPIYDQKGTIKTEGEEEKKVEFDPNNAKYETAVGVNHTLAQIQHQFDTRILEFKTLKDSVLVTRRRLSSILRNPFPKVEAEDRED